MKQYEVKIVHLQGSQRLKHGLIARFEPVEPNLGSQENFLAGHSRILQGLPDVLLIAVILGRVNQPIAHLEGIAHAAERHALVGSLVGAEPQHGHLNTIIQFHVLHNKR